MPRGRSARACFVAMIVIPGAFTDRATAQADRPSGDAKPTSTETSPQEPTAMTTDAAAKRTNRLIHATSPYLLQHARNPVDWHEWNAEALDKARRLDMPIFLSIGYAACHWCHVMEHESFEDEEVAAVLNAGFVNIKVDREERPDIDDIYMAYTQQTTGGGGWPMSVWLTPAGEPFFAGTYFPKPQFLELLGRIREYWTGQRDQLLQRSSAARTFLEQWASGAPPAEGVIPREVVDQTALTLARYFDRTHGGLRGGGTNKFPPSMAMELMLRVHRRTGQDDLRTAVEITLDHMARGGIYDHLGGGICRYSTDIEWLVPHFEKMLYDQALVSAIYLDGYLVTRNAFHARVAADIFDYVLDDLQSPEGGFYSSRDADSDGLEGAFYIWTLDEVKKLLGEEDARLFAAWYDVTESGNWFERLGHAPAGPKNILRITKSPEAFARTHDLTVETLNEKLAAWRKTMRDARAKRTPPGLDDKVLTAWNGLMIASLARGGRILENAKEDSGAPYVNAAARAADFILANMRTEDGRLLRSWRRGQARLTAYLDDYAFLVEGLLNLYEATFDPRWLDEARRLTDLSIKYYHDPDAGGFFLTASDAERLIARPKSPHDGAIPSGNSVQAMNLLRLAIMLDRKDYREKAESTFRAFAAMAVESPGAFERLNCAADFYHDQVLEIAIIGDPARPETQALIRTAFDRFLPNKVVMHAADALPDTPYPLLKGRTLVKGQPAAYVCQNYRCQLPVTGPDELAAQLSRPASNAE